MSPRTPIPVLLGPDFISVSACLDFVLNHSNKTSFHCSALTLQVPELNLPTFPRVPAFDSRCGGKGVSLPVLLYALLPSVLMRASAASFLTRSMHQCQSTCGPTTKTSRFNNAQQKPHRVYRLHPPAAERRKIKIDFTRPVRQICQNDGPSPP